MKKMVNIVLVCMLFLISLTVSNAMADRVEPIRTKELLDIEHGDWYLPANYDPVTAFDSDGCMTLTLLAEELYKTHDVKTAKPGDIIQIYGEDHIIKKSETSDDDNIIVYVDDDEAPYEFYHRDDDIMFTSDCDIPSRATVGVYTLPLAEHVKVTAWYITENQEQSQDKKTDILNAADVQPYLLARNDESKDDYLNCMGNHVNVRAQNGKITEIVIDWGADD